MASFSVPCPKCIAFASCGSQPPNLQQQQHSKVFLPTNVCPRPSLQSGSVEPWPVSTRFQGSKRNQSTVWKAQVKEVAVEKSSNATVASSTNLEAPSTDAKDEKSTKDSVISDAFISSFMTEVSNLVKLVDSRDIVELQLKQQDCEVIIRKKEALPQPAAPAPIVTMHPPSVPEVHPSQPPPVHTPAASAPASSSPPALPAPAKSSKSSHPTLKCPMAGTFYRCPGPGEPPFIKVGDKVQKGQVVCIVEAMKLMNEIESDQSGTVVEVLVEDGKPVSVDMPLFMIEP